MKKAGKFLEKNKGKLWFAVCLNLTVLVCTLALMPPLYETNDDVAIRELINGAREVRDPHLVYQNIVLGLIYKVLYHFTIGIPWYDLVQYFTILASLTAVSYVLLNRLETGRGLTAVLILQMFFAVECYVRPQYTKTAGIAAAAGLFLLFWLLDRRRMRWWETVWGIGLVCMGFLYRYTEAAVCMAIVSALGLHFLIGLRKGDKENGGKSLRRIFCLLGTLTLLLALLYTVDFYAYEAVPMWKSYKEFNELRTELLDYGFPDYAANQEEYEKLGINQDALALYSSWNFNDPDKFNIPVMKRLVEMKPERSFTIETVRTFAETVPGILRGSYTFQCVAAFGIMWLIWGRRRGREWICLLYAGIVWGIFYLYLFYMGRYGVNRVDTGMWFSITLVIGSFLNGERTAKLRRGICAALTVILCGLALWKVRESCRPYLWLYHQEDEAGRAALREVLEALGTDQENLYLIKGGCISEYDCYGTFDVMPGEILNNMCWLSGWDCNLAGQKKVLENFGVSNPFRDLIGRRDVILVDNNIELTLRYIRTYYDSGAEAEFLETVGNVNLYRIVSGTQTQRNGSEAGERN